MLKCAAVEEALFIYYQLGVPTSFSGDAIKSYLARAVSNEHFFMMLSFILMHASVPIFLIAAMVVVRSSTHVYAYVRQWLSSVTVLTRVCAYIPTTHAALNAIHAQLELWLLVALVVYLVTPARSFLFLFIYLNYLRMRYLLSAHLRAVFTQANRIIMSAVNHDKCPAAVKTYYVWGTSKLYSLVDPEQLAQQQQQAPSCNIM